MEFCSIMTGTGFDDLGFLGSFSMAWLGLVILFFIILFARKWIGEEAGLPFNWIYASVGAGMGYILTITLSCSYKWALVIGLAGLIVGGFGIGYFTGSEGGEY